ncbi:protein-tyrosine phosphatase [Anopheles sinensis]|uniref:Protein-tyrosine phosphatase n=1 Tax=Anopheles sinensis TaxID=74873 RepID=A0A084WPE8_ANOSI|nr:protein-tyrosine phosphatase [Anopheles sinensis]
MYCNRVPATTPRAPRPNYRKIFRTAETVLVSTHGAVAFPARLDPIAKRTAMFERRWNITSSINTLPTVANIPINQLKS